MYLLRHQITICAYPYDQIYGLLKSLGSGLEQKYIHNIGIMHS